MKVLMIGLGAIGQRHVRNLVTLRGTDLELLAFRQRRLDTVLTDRMQVESPSGLEKKYHIQSYGDLDEALAQKPEIAFVCNPSALHIPVALKVARAGCHLFLEKPLSNSLDGLDDLAAVLRETGKVAYVGYQMRYHPCLKLVRKLLKSDAIGRVLAVRAEVGEYLPGWHPFEDYRQTYGARRDLGGGTLLSQIHEMDYLYWLFGMPKSVYCLGGHLSSLEVDVEDMTSTLMAFEAGGHPLPVHLQQDFVQRPPSRNCEIIGDAGKILMDLGALKVSHYDARGTLAREDSFPDFPRNQLFLDQTAHFLACVDGKETPLAPLEDGIRTLRMALAAQQSLASGKVVEF